MTYKRGTQTDRQTDRHVPSLAHCFIGRVSSVLENIW